MSVSFERLKILLLRVNESVVPEKQGHRNLLAIDVDNEIVWIAKLPMNETYAYYNQIRLEEQVLWGWSGSTLCIIDPKTGVILDEKFVK